MASYEVQARSRLGWQIVGVFDVYEQAQDCALQFDRERVYDDLRVTREIEDPQTGRFRATTVFKCGQQVRDEMVREEAERERLAAVQKRQQRLGREAGPRWSGRSGELGILPKITLHFALWIGFLVVTGLALVHYFEFVLFGR